MAPPHTGLYSACIAVRKPSLLSGEHSALPGQCYWGTALFTLYTASFSVGFNHVAQYEEGGSLNQGQLGLQNATMLFLNGLLHSLEDEWTSYS